MKCLTCNECLDKEICGRLNGYFSPPKVLISYRTIICVKFPELLNFIKKNEDKNNVQDKIKQK